MMLDAKVREDMIFLWGQINGLLYECESKNSDLIEVIERQYVSILKRLYVIENCGE